MEYVGSLRELYRRRRDAMLDALAEHFPREAEWTYPQGGLFLWATLPDYIDTTDLLARALQENVAFVPGRAAYLDGRGGSSMRLNFSGVGEDDIREGVRRIGKVVREQVGLYGTLTGRWAGEPARRPDARRRDELANVLHLRAARAARDSREARRGAQGRALARAPGLAAVGRAGGGRARAPRATTSIADRRRRRPRASGYARRGPTSRSSPCTAATARTAPCRSCSSSWACPTPGRASRPASAPPTRCWPSTPCATPGIPTPDFYAFNQTAFRELGAAAALPAIEERLEFPIVVKPAGPGLGAGDQVRPHRRPTCPPRWWRPSPTTTRCCSSATWPGATWPCRCSTATVAADRRGGPDRGGRSTTSRPATRSAAPSSCARPSCPTTTRRAAQDLALRVFALLGLRRLRARGPDARARRRASCTCSRPTRSRA